MKVFALIVQFLFSVLLLVIPKFQGSRSPRFMKFYRRMAEKEWARKGFTLLLATVALLWNFAFFIEFGAIIWLLPSLGLSCLLLVHGGIAHPLLYLLAESRRGKVILFTSILAMVIMHVILGLPPAFISLYVTLALLLDAACFYPTRKAMWAVEDYLEGQRYRPDDDELYMLYFSELED